MIFNHQHLCIQRVFDILLSEKGDKWTNFERKGLSNVTYRNLHVRRELLKSYIDIFSPGKANEIALLTLDTKRLKNYHKFLPNVSRGSIHPERFIL